MPMIKDNRSMRGMWPLQFNVGFCLLIMCLLILPGRAVLAADDTGTPGVPLNGNFEVLAPNGFAAQWLIGGEGDDTAARVEIDGERPYEGRNSLSIHHPQWQRSVVFSDPLTLKVGHLYRLSGRIRTRSVESDPLARYPTAVGACLAMESQPFTNHSPTVGGSSDWTPIEMLFIATRSRDRVRLLLGHNGNARGKAWFDDIRLEKVEDITTFIPMETVKWVGPAFRYDDRGWIYVHIEGTPYKRGYQYGYLLAEEIVAYIGKLSVRAVEKDPAEGWNFMRRITDALMLRKYDQEYLTEMKGIADGAARAGAMVDDRPVDLLDIVAMNSSVDIGQVWRGLKYTPHALSGQNFLAAEEEMDIPEDLHKCSAFLANGPASKDGKIVFGQIFMWNGYTGVHWNVICDVVPEKGHRLVYHTFPGGIHSGADFYINASGIMIGETTVRQTPFEANGTPQSNRIRKAAQYASSIDDVVRILGDRNNGMYANDWLIGDTKTNETAIFLLGTKKSRLWRSGGGDFPGGTTGFYWSNNNNKDDEVRKEYVPNPDNAPYDLVFEPWNRDIAFNRFFQEHNGKIDAVAGVNLWASSPINRSHACDGKITTSEMAEKLVFLAHSGKTTLRSKFLHKSGRPIAELPGAVPHLALGYSTVSPVFVADKLRALRPKGKQTEAVPGAVEPGDLGVERPARIKNIYSYDARRLWFNTVYPATAAENWFVSATAAYWEILKDLPDEMEEAESYMTKKMAELNTRLNYTVSREGPVVPVQAQRVYDRYNHYRVPRIRGTFLLHQLRLYLGNATFSRMMTAVHTRFKEKPVTNERLIALWEKTAGSPLKSFVMQWINGRDLPQITPMVEIQQEDSGWQLHLKVKQTGAVYHFLTTLAVETAKGKSHRIIEVKKEEQSFRFMFGEKPLAVEFNLGGHMAVPREHYYSFSNYFDDFHHTVFVYGTSRHADANRDLTLRYRELLANRFTEILPPVRKDSEMDPEALATHDLFVLGGIADNELIARIAGRLPIQLGKNFFTWHGKTYGDWDDGICVAYPNPFNPQKALYLVIANSAAQLHLMTENYEKLPSWTLYKGGEIVEDGYHDVAHFRLKLD